MSKKESQIFLLKYKVLNELKLSENFEQNIRLLYVFKDDCSKENVFMVTNDDEVYCFGSNSRGLLGFGHEIEVNEMTLSQDLSHKQIIDFKNSCYHVIARTSDGEIYCWGHNKWGYLGNGKDDENIHKPELNQYLSGKQIIAICCGGWHTIVLTVTGEVYSWGGNLDGQIGNASDERLIAVPQRLNDFNGEKVKAISCGLCHSLALTEGGRVFSWGLNISGHLGVSDNSLKKSNKPILIKMNEVTIEKISCGQNHSILLSSDGDIYVFGDNECKQLGIDDKGRQFIPEKLIHSEKFIDISAHFYENISISVSDKNVFYIWGKCGEKEILLKPKETEFNSFEEIFANYFQITNKTIELELFRTLYKIKLFRKNTTKDSKHLDKKEFSYNSRYEHEYDEKELIGSGGFGIVYKALHLLEDQYYAVKKVCFKENSDDLKVKCLKELQLMSKLQSDHIVQYKSYWTENNAILYIQMELCLNSLKEIIKILNKELNQKLSELMTPLGYCIASELFTEILECVDYLHKQNIIHSDLKPENILITNGMNGRFVKIADFGLFEIHDYKLQSHTGLKNLGTIEYMAPEVIQTKKYDIKSDIYSLGVIVPQIFNIDINEPIGENTGLETKYSNLFELTEKMSSRIRNRRPNCEEILSERTTWGLSLNEMQNNEDLELRSDSSEIFYMHFIEVKSKYKK